MQLDQKNQKRKISVIYRMSKIITPIIHKLANDSIQVLK